MKTKTLLFLVFITSFYLKAQVTEITNLQDASSGENSGFKYDLTEMNGSLYFINDAESLYKIDETNEVGVILIKTIDISTTGIQDKLLQVMGNNLFFVGKINDGYELWKSDGTESGTIMVKDINVDLLNSQPEEFFIYNSYKLYL